jgi:hypothetical protein
MIVVRAVTESIPQVFRAIRACGWAWSGGRDFTQDSLRWFVRYLLNFTPILITLTVADNLSFVGPLRIAVLGNCADPCCAQFQWPVICAYDPQSESACGQFPYHLWRTWLEMLPQTTMWDVVVCSPIAMVYFYRRRDQDIAKALHDSELARAELKRRTLEAELQTMQARVDPSFLFETLGDIRDPQSWDPGAGELMLNELIDYLRAALPDVAAAVSTLGQEATLARAYLEILRFRTRGRLVSDLQIPTELRNAISGYGGAAIVDDGSRALICRVAKNNRFALRQKATDCPARLASSRLQLGDRSALQ